MYQTLAINTYKSIPSQRHQAVSLFPAGQTDQVQINAMKLGSCRRNHRRSSVSTPPLFLLVA